MTSQVWLDTDLVSLRKAVWCAGREVISQALRSWGCLLLLVGSLGLSAHSQQLTEPPNAPSFNKKLFIIELSTYTTINVLDGITTAQSIHKGYVEGNFPAGSSYLLGRRPSVVRYAVTMGLIAVRSIARPPSAHMASSR